MAVLKRRHGAALAILQLEATLSYATFLHTMSRAEAAAAAAGGGGGGGGRGGGRGRGEAATGEAVAVLEVAVALQQHVMNGLPVDAFDDDDDDDDDENDQHNNVSSLTTTSATTTSSPTAITFGSKNACSDGGGVGNSGVYNRGSGGGSVGDGRVSDGMPTNSVRRGGGGRGGGRGRGVRPYELRCRSLGAECHRRLLQRMFDLLLGDEEATTATIEAVAAVARATTTAATAAAPAKVATEVNDNECADTAARVDRHWCDLLGCLPPQERATALAEYFNFNFDRDHAAAAAAVATTTTGSGGGGGLCRPGPRGGPRCYRLVEVEELLKQGAAALKKFNCNGNFNNPEILEHAQVRIG
jgi:hypothetical protein